MGINSFHKLAGITAILSGVIAFISVFIGAAMLDYNFEAFSNPVLILTLAAHKTQYVKWSMLADMFGYYLLLVPGIIFVHQWLKEKDARMPIYTFSGLFYVMIGAMGAAVLAALWPALISDYAAAPLSQQEGVKALFMFITNLVYGGMWNILETFVAAVWWIGIGTVLWKEKKIFAFITILLGIFSFLDSAGNMMEMHTLAEAGLNGYLVLAPVWAIWLGVVALRD